MTALGTWVTVERPGDRGRGKLAAVLLDQSLEPWLEATTQRLRVARQAGQIPNGVDLEVAAGLLYGPVYTGGCCAPDRSQGSTSLPWWP
jgi:hypothetical protein